MSRSRILAAASAVSAFALGTLLIASPASAASLPDGQRITVINDDSGEFFEADPATAALTAVGGSGIPLVDGTIPTAVDVDERTGLGYALVFEVQPDWGPAWIVPVDASTGTAGDPVPVSIPSVGTLAFGCHALVLLDGVYYTSCFTGSGDERQTHFGTIDPVTGVVEVLTTFDGEILFTAFAANPVNGEFWAFEYRGADGFSGSWTVDPADWSFTAFDELDYPVWSADYDREGQLFASTTVVTEEQEIYPALMLVDPLGGVFTEIGEYTISGESLSDEAELPLTIWGEPEPALPATGGAFESVPLTLGAGFLLLAGAALLLTRRIDRRA